MKTVFMFPPPQPVMCTDVALTPQNIMLSPEPTEGLKNSLDQQVWL